jgi:hypothetical protein
MIKHKEKLGNYLDYSYIYYDHLTDHVSETYKKFEEDLRKLGYVFGAEPYDPTGAILLENYSEVIAGTIWTDAVYPTAIKILTTVIKEEYRGKKIYQTLHLHLNKIAKQLDRKHIIANVHANNKKMLDTILCLDDYKVVCHMIHRKVPD